MLPPNAIAVCHLHWLVCHLTFCSLYCRPFKHFRELDRSYWDWRGLLSLCLDTFHKSVRLASSICSLFKCWSVFFFEMYVSILWKTHTIMNMHMQLWTEVCQYLISPVNDDLLVYLNQYDFSISYSAAQEEKRNVENRRKIKLYRTNNNYCSVYISVVQ